MAKFSSKTAVKQRPVRKVKTAIQTTGQKGTTFEGGVGYARDAKSDLFLLAVTNMVGEDTFYESATDRDQRFLDLVRKVTEADPAWVAAFIPYLRKDMFMRSASVVAAAEYVAAGGPNGRAVIASALQRADEPAELLAYWHATYGRAIPKPVKRGLADAVNRLYTEYAALKYDGASRGVRMADVIELVRPRPKDPAQRVLFEYLLDRRHHPDAIRADLGSLPMIVKARDLDALSGDALRARFQKEGVEVLAGSGYTWERLSGKMTMDAEAWEAIIPQMGYMALLRNLRNFSQAGISKSAQKYVNDFLSDPEKVARSMQFPYRFYSAWKATGDLKYAQAIETGLDLSTQNIPELKGRSLILVDVSASMQNDYYGSSRGKSTVAPWEKGALFGVAQFLRAEKADLVAYATGNRRIDLQKGTSVLRGIEQVGELVRSGSLNHGTNTFQAIEKHYDGHDRVVIFSDMQSTYHYGSGQLIDKIPFIYNFNLAGYAPAHMEVGTDGRYELGGFSDAVFRMMALIESGSRKADKWPWEIGG